MIYTLKKPGYYKIEEQCEGNPFASEYKIIFHYSREKSDSDFTGDPSILNGDGDYFSCCVYNVYLGIGELWVDITNTVNDEMMTCIEDIIREGGWKESDEKPTGSYFTEIFL